MAFESPAGEAPSRARIHVFCRVTGARSAPWLTLLHGFPSSSWDYAKVLPDLEKAFRALAFDFLGFGDSDKPRRWVYSIHQQTDLTEAVWRHFAVERTWVVAHDYGVSVAQELLARRAEGNGAAEIRGVTFLNGGLYADLHRPLRIQRLLRKPIVGAFLSSIVNQSMFRRNFRRVFSTAHQPGEDELAQHWAAIARRGGHRLGHRLIHYIADREQHHERWERALETTTVPLHFVWGMADPVSGAHVAKRLRERLPHARGIELSEIGHYPQLEAPDLVEMEIRRMALA